MTPLISSLPTENRRDRYGALLETWCSALLALQVGEVNASVGGLRGGILCPACARIHGRSADAVYPLLFQARALQSDTYRTAAIELLDWSHQATTPDGAFLNEPTGHAWKGITVFSLLALGEALRHHGDLLEEAVQQRWRDRLRRGADFLMGFIENLWKSNINYPVSGAAALAVAAGVLGEASYRQRAQDLMRECLPYFRTENTLLFGEGKPMDGFSPHGCRAIDLGYNVEESLPNLALCAHLLGDDEARAVAVRSLQSHLEFLLPDGAWDNSWGSRSFKWTYWGSRTSDGCQGALALLADADDRFLPASDRNVALLESCTHNGILYGGPHLRENGELPCIHHTFCHAKALAAALDTPALQPLAKDAPPESTVPISLPREIGKDPVRLFPEIATGLIAWGKWRATITAYDWKYSVGEEHPGGGALSLLWHEAIGPIFAASMTTYREIEPSNMQPLRGGEPPLCLTPQLLLGQNGTILRSLLDTGAQVEYKTDTDGVVVTIRGHLTGSDTNGQSRESLPKELRRAASRRLKALSRGVFSRRIPFLLRYRFEEQGVEIAAEVGAGRIREGENVILQLPIIASQQEMVRLPGSREAIVEKPGAELIVTSNADFLLPYPVSQRYFNPVPGFETYPLRVPVIPGQVTSLCLRMK